MAGAARQDGSNEILSAGWEEKSYAGYIQTFVDAGGFDNATYREMADNLEHQDYTALYDNIDEFKNGSSDFSGTSTLTRDEVNEVLEVFSEDQGGNTEARKAFVNTARGYVGKIPYYYGGAIYLTRVLQDESLFGKQSDPKDAYYDYNYSHKTTFKGRSYQHRTMIGLDCSSFVSFVLKKAGVSEIVLNSTADCPGEEFYDHSKLRPGDIGMVNARGAANQGGSNHMGIYAGKDTKGRDVWIHCAGSTGAVCNNYSGFRVYYRLFD